MNTITHFELPAGDTQRALGFWGGLFGWKFQSWEGSPVEYHMIEGGEPGGAIYPSDDAGSGPMIYFLSEDIDASVAKVRELGGSADDKQPIPTIGWYSHCKDTEGNRFGLFQSDESVTAPSA